MWFLTAVGFETVCMDIYTITPGMNKALHTETVFTVFFSVHDSILDHDKNNLQVILCIIWQPLGRCIRISEEN